MSVLLARWFTIQRGRAMMLAFVGSSLGSVIVVPVIGWLIEQYDWRTALLAMGTVDTVVLLILALIVRERPRADEREKAVSLGQSGSQGNLSGQGIREEAGSPEPVGTLLRMPQFWCIGLSCALALAILQTVIVTLVPLAIETGLTPMQAAGLISVTGGAAITSKLLLSIVADRFDRIYLLAVLTGLGLIVNLLLIVEADYFVFIACAVMLGIASSAMSPIFFALLADRFGLASFGTVRGLMAVLISGFGAIAVRGAGEVYDRAGSYDPVFYSFMVIGVLSVFLMLATRFTRSAGVPRARDVAVQA
jgi:predicted MFS family arabinose efflux permease